MLFNAPRRRRRSYQTRFQNMHVPENGEQINKMTMFIYIAICTIFHNHRIPFLFFFNTIKSNETVKTCDNRKHDSQIKTMRFWTCISRAQHVRLHFEHDFRIRIIFRYVLFLQIEITFIYHVYRTYR